MVDSHVHAFPPHIVHHRDAYLERDSWFHLLHGNPRSHLLEADAVIDEMNAAGVELAVLCGFPWRDPALCHEHNVYMADAARRFPHRIAWLGIVAPGSPACESEARWCFEHGAAGIGELNSDAQSFDWRDTDSLNGLVALCRANDRPVLLHASEPLGHHYPGKGTATPDKLIHFIGHFRELRVIAAHWGGGLPFHELMPEIEQVTTHVVYDCAASTYLYRPRVFRAVLDIVGHERVLFGSDYPVLKMGRFLSRVREIGWRSAAEERAVLGDNARRVFRLSERLEHGR